MQDFTAEYWENLSKILFVQKGDPFPHISYAKFVVDLCQDSIRYIPELGKWLQWQGAIWKQVPDDNPAFEAVETAVSTLMGWGAQHPQIATQAVGFVAPMLSASYRGGIIASMKNLSSIRVSVNDLNANPDLLACPNGTINLRTREFYPPRPTDLLTRMVCVPYKENAVSELWTQFLESCHPANLDRILYLQALLGYASTGHTNEEISAFFYGGGRNGKGVFTDTIECLMGDFSTTMPSDFWLNQYGGRNGAMLGKLDGPRLCISPEMSSQKLDEEFYKDLTGGGNISCNPKYGHPYDFTSKVFILWSGNERPKIVNTDDSVWRRMKLIPWEESFKGKSGDPKLKEKLRSEENLQGVLSWLVAGAQQWYTEGLPESESIDNATEEYRKDSNPNYDWARATFEEDADGFVSTTVIKLLGGSGVGLRPRGKDQGWSKAVAASFPEAVVTKFRGERGVRGIKVK